MSKNVAIVYWSGTGNTEEMARAVAAGVESAGGTAFVVAVGDFSADGADGYDALAFGCPAMGAEELESDEFEPVWDECREVIGERPVALFGSYDWGTGEWMETWRADAEAAGVNVMSTVIANNAPDDEALEACSAAGRVLVG
ncbi:flavodoxin [Thermophilibacter provencensis]|uniref:Flavodoxin n=1 Tax=Thermophilibacter provencensis TaxID=1852386 RepID=A0A921GDS0_9ACTN|nr:flavodoxin [Thermophilibacter provencensis]HJF44238.1 flavodoxin [Thermophilibacter provencensis]